MYGYDKQGHMQFRDVCLIPRGEQYVMTKYFPTATRTMQYNKILLATALKNHRIIYEPLCSGTSTGKKGRMKKVDARTVNAIQLDGEYPPDPVLCYALWYDVYDVLLKHNAIEVGQSIQFGAGGKMVIPVLLFASNDEESVALHDAWNFAFYSKILPDWLQPVLNKSKLAGKMKFDFCTLTQPCAADWTWRPTNPTKNDAPMLKEGTIRRTELGDGKRHHTGVLDAIILEAKNHPPKSTKGRMKEREEIFNDQPVDLLEEVYQQVRINDANQLLKHAKNYIHKYEIMNTSGDHLSSLVNAMLSRNYAVETVVLCAPEINEMLGRPHKTDAFATAAVQKAVNNYKPYKKVYPKRDSIEEDVSVGRNIRANEEENLILSDWIDQSLRFFEGSKLPKRPVYETYASYCQNIGVIPVGPNTFFRMMKAKGFDKEGTTYIHGKNTVCYFDIAFRIQEVKREVKVVALAV